MHIRAVRVPLVRQLRRPLALALPLVAASALLASCLGSGYTAAPPPPPSTTSTTAPTATSTSTSTSPSTTPTSTSTSSTTSTTVASAPPSLFQDAFDRPDGLVTNEYAYWNPTLPDAVVSPDWEMTSGSLFTRDGHGYTGVPDDVGPNAQSTNGTDSAVFRLTTKENDFGNVAVSFDLDMLGLTTTATTPAVAWDGLHVFLRYQNEYSLYYASIDRRDGTTIIKKKVPGGPSNGGTYYDLGQSGSHPIPFGQWEHVRATIDTNANGSVIIQLYANDTLVASAVDDGSIGGPPILSPGKVGIRGDNAEFEFDDFTVNGL